MSITSNQKLDDVKSAISKGHFDLQQLNELRSFIVSVSVLRPSASLAVGSLFEKAQPG